MKKAVCLVWLVSIVLTSAVGAFILIAHGYVGDGHYGICWDNLPRIGFGALCSVSTATTMLVFAYPLYKLMTEKDSE